MGEKAAGIISAVLAALVVLGVSHAFAGTNEVTPFAGLKEEYTDNLFYSSKNESEDWISTLTGGVRYRFKDAGTTAGAEVRVDALRYAHDTELNDIDQSYRADVARQQTERFSWQANASVIRDSRPGRDIDVTGLVLNSDIRHRQHYAAEADYRITEITIGSVSYDFLQDRFNNPRDSDVTSHNLSLSLARDMSRWWSNTTAYLSSGAEWYEYDTASIRSYSLTLGLRRYLTELLNLDISAGARYTRSHFDVFSSDSDDWGGVGRMSLSYQLEKLNCQVSILHDVQSASSRTGVTERTSLTARVGYRFLERMTGSLFAGIYLNKADAAVLSQAGVNETTFRFYPSLRWRLADTLHIKLSYSYSEVKDHERDSDARRNAVLVSLRWEWIGD